MWLSEASLYVRYIPGFDFFIRPYAKLSLVGQFVNKSKEFDTLHDNDLRGASPPREPGVSYIFTSERRPFPLSPELGAQVDMTDNFKILVGVGYERVEWTYFKSINGGTNYDEFDKTWNDVLNLRVGFCYRPGNATEFGFTTSFLEEAGLGGYLSISFSF